jgi:hypothetical protein
MAKKTVKLSVGRGEKLPASRGAGLTAKGRAKHNRETGSNLKTPTKDKDNPRHKSFCARSGKSRTEGNFPVRRRFPDPENGDVLESQWSLNPPSRSWKGERGMAARKRWGC